MDIHLLRTFLAVADFEGIRKAADYLHLTPSAVSSRVRQLEREIGAPLFERDRKGVLLSAAGLRLKERAERMIDDWSQLKRDVLQDDEVMLNIRLGASDVIWRTWLLPRLSKIPDNSELSLLLTTAGRADLARMLIGGALDCAILPEEIRYPGIDAMQVGELELTLVSSTVEPATYVDVDWGEEFRSNAAEAFPLPAASRADINIAWLGLEWLLQKGGMAWLPAALVEPHITAGSLHPVGGVDSISLPVFAAMNKENPVVYRWLRQMLAAE